MPLLSNDKPYAQYHAEVLRDPPALFLDTSVIVELCRPERKADLDALLEHGYCLLVCIASMFEFSFGPRRSEHEISFLHRLINQRHLFDGTDFQFHKPRGEPGRLYTVHPTANDWLAAQCLLIERIRQQGDVRGKAPNYKKGKDLHAFDALIFRTASNRSVPICTSDVEGFELLNRASCFHAGSSPIFTLDEALASLTSDVCYEPPPERANYIAFTEWSGRFQAELKRLRPAMVPKHLGGACLEAYQGPGKANPESAARSYDKKRGPYVG